MAPRILNFLFRIPLHELGPKLFEKVESHLLIIAHVCHYYKDVAVLLEDMEVKPE